MAHLLVGVRALVDQRHILLDLARHDLEVRETAILVGNRLEYQRAGRAVRRAVDLNQLALFILADLNRLFVRGRHVIRDALEQRIRTDARGRRAAEYRRDDQILHALTDAGDQLFVRELLARKIALHQLFGQLGHVFTQRRAVLVDTVLHVVRNRDFHALVAIHAVSLADDAVDNADGVAVAFKDRHDNRGDRHAELLLQLMQRGIVIRVFLVNLGDVEHTGHRARLAALPRLFRADARAGLAGGDNQRGLRHAQCAIYFAFKIKKARGVQQVDLAAVPLDRRNRRRNRKFALDFLGIEITNSIAVRDLTDTVGHTGDIEHAFDERGLAVAAVSHQTYVTNLVNRVIGHI